jgi:site-specific recombinase XerD
MQVVSGTVAYAVTAFLIDRRAERLAARTVQNYQSELRLFSEFLDNQGVITLEELTPDVIRLYLVHLAERRNGGGCHVAFRVIRALLNWAWDEYDLQTRNPITRVKAPKRNTDALPGVEMADVNAMVEACSGDDYALRDKAILLALLDTGARAFELAAWDVANYDPASGRLIIDHGKGGKRRAVFVGKTTRRAIMAYLRTRGELEIDDPLFLSRTGERLTFDGLRHVVDRRAAAAGIEAPGLHDFRRAFALAMLRAGTDLHTLAELMGHSDLQVLKRYLKLVDDDLKDAHGKGSPVEQMIRKKSNKRK